MNLLILPVKSKTNSEFHPYNNQPKHMMYRNLKNTLGQESFDSILQQAIVKIKGE